MTKFVISGVSGFRNRGVNALVTTTVQGIQTVDPSAQITVISDTTDYDELHAKKLKVHFVQDVFRTRKGKLIRRISQISRTVARRLSPPLIQVIETVEDTDVIIASGGDIFSSDYGDQDDFLIPLKVAQNAGKKVVFMGHSIGPFKSKQEAEMWSEVARKSDLITIRESLSYKYVCKELGIPEEKVFLTADSAFILEKPSLDKLQKIRSYYGIEKEKPTIALSISQGIIRFSGTNADHHFNTWKNIVRTLLVDMDAQILLIPHVQERAAFNDDRIVQSAIVEEFGYDSRIKLISGDHDACELKGIISMANLVIAERMHAGIAGLSNGIPTALIGYSVKAKGVIQDIFGDKGEEYGLLVSIRDLVSDTETEKWLKNLWMNRMVICEELHRQLPKFQALAQMNFELLKQVVTKQ